MFYQVQTESKRYNSFPYGTLVYKIDRSEALPYLSPYHFKAEAIYFSHTLGSVASRLPENLFCYI